VLRVRFTFFVAVGFVCIGAFAGASIAHADEVSDMRGLIEAHSEQLRRQSLEMKELGDRLRVLEDEQSAAPPANTSPVAAGSAPQSEAPQLVSSEGTIFSSALEVFF
jgi:hypothetical protein